MSGLFGGILELVESVGHIILYILIGGEAKNKNARGFRLTFGAITLGVFAGLIPLVTVALLPAEASTPDAKVSGTCCCIAFPVVAVLFVWFLEWVKTMIEGDVQ